jgi:hypothetical protein
MQQLDRTTLLYQPYFCEENVLQLLQSSHLPESRCAMFISNANKTVAMWGQKASRNKNEPVVWDYHVVLLLPKDGLVLDLDNREKLVWPLREWLEYSFRKDLTPEHLVPMFRIISKKEFETKFSSDRSHMLNPESGLPLKPFPKWEAPFNSTLGMNLMRWVDVSDTIGGTVVDQIGLEQLCNQIVD